MWQEPQEEAMTEKRAEEGTKEPAVGTYEHHDEGVMLSATYVEAVKQFEEMLTYLHPLTIMDFMKRLADRLDPDSDEYKEFLAHGLNRVADRKPFKTKLFDALARKSISIPFEALAFKVEEDTLKVWVAKRLMTDTAYPGQLHAPGAIRWPGEYPQETADRLSNKEFGGVPLKFFAKVGDFISDEARGPMNSELYIVELEKDPPAEDGKHCWVAVDKLSDYNMVDIHLERIIPTTALIYASTRRLPFRLSGKIEITPAK